MFADGDPFGGVRDLMPALVEDAHETTPVAPSNSPVHASVTTASPPSSQPAESSRAASKRKAVDPLPAPSSQSVTLSRPGDGWYIVHTGVLPGVYYGV